MSRETLRARQNRVRRERRELLIKLCGGACESCGTDDGRCLDFHHDKGEKHFILGREQLTRSLSRLLVEVNKCILLCANCHRIKHAEEHNRETNETLAA